MMEKAEIRAGYQSFARWFDLAEAVPELLGVRRLRRKLLRHAKGRVLEVAIGTGKNLPHYPEDCRVTGIDLSRAMLDRTRRRARRLGRDVRLVEMDAERLAFPGDSFDTVVDSLSLCTFPAPEAALREMARVCRPSGRVLLLEHGRSDRGWLGRWQDRRATRHAEKLGCHWNREPRELVEAAGLHVEEGRRSFLGIFHRIRVRRGSRRPPRSAQP